MAPPVLPFLLLPVVLASTADSSGQPTLSVSPFAGPLQPGTEALADVIASIPCDGDPPAQGVRFLLDGALPGWLEADLLAPEAPLSPSDCRDGHALAATSLRVRVAEDAPALRPHVIVVEAQAQTEDGPLNLTGSLPVEVAYRGRVEMTPEPERQVTHPGGFAQFPIRVTNTGNQNTRVQVSVARASEGLSVMVPPPLTLESAATGGERVSSLLVVSVQVGDALPPGERTIVLQATPTMALDPKLRGEPVEVTLHVETRGNAVPAPVLPLLLAIAGVVALSRLRCS